jgi:hypothetical protein
VHERAFVFSLEAFISLALFISLILLLPSPQPASLEKLLVMQKEHDLLKAWHFELNQENSLGLRDKSFFDQDFRRVFPGQAGKLEIFRAGQELEVIEFNQGDKTAPDPSSALAVEGFFYLKDSPLPFELLLTVYLNPVPQD